MKKTIVLPIIICCLAVYCTPPPKRPEKKNQLHLENLIYSVALSSLRMAHQMDVKRKNAVLKKVERQLQQEREQSAVALDALKEHLEDLVNSRFPAKEGNDAISMSELQSPAIPIEEKLTQLEALVFGGDIKGILFQVEFLKGKLSIPPEAVSASPADGVGDPASASASPADGVGDPVSASASPADGVGDPASASASTTDGVGDPASASASPADGDGDPASASASTTDGVGDPASASASPADGDGDPASASALPADGAGDPASVSASPADGAGDPASVSASTTDGADEPASVETADGSVVSDTAEVTATSEQATAETADLTRLTKLEILIYGKQDSPGILLQVLELQSAWSPVNLTPAETQALTEKVTTTLKEQSLPANTDLSVEARLTRLENALHGSAENEGIISVIAYLQARTARLELLSTEL